MTDSMRDWPLALKRNAAIIELAAHIFKARAEVFGGPQDLSDQPPSVRQDYITRADELLKTLAPRQIITGLHRRDRVIGSIGL